MIEMMKKLIAVVVGVIMVFTSLFTPFVAEATRANTATTMTQYNKIVKKNLNSLNTSFSVTYTGNQATLRKNLDRIIPDQIKNDPLINATVKSYKYTGSSSRTKLVINYKMTYFSTKAQERYAQQQSKKIAQSIMKKNKGDFNRVKAVNDYIVGRATYGGKGNVRYTTYGVLKNRTAVCQGYAITAYRMFKEMNIPVQYVRGNSKNQNHVWLKVKVNKTWHNLDVTWNDPTPNNNYNRKYNYFLISDREMSKTHRWNNSGYAKATSKKYDFFKRTSSVAQNGNTIYYANSKNRERLYSFNISTGKHRKVSNTRVQNLAYTKGKLYFSNFSNRGKLARMNTNGKAQRNLNNKFTKNVHIKGNYVMYQVGNKFYKRKA